MQQSLSRQVSVEASTFEATHHHLPPATIPQFCKPATYEFSYDPYDFERSRLVSYAIDRPRPQAQDLPKGTFHRQLADYLTFVRLALPHQQDPSLPRMHTPDLDRNGCQPGYVRAFIGQLPYELSPEMLMTLCRELGANPVGARRITKRGPGTGTHPATGSRIPTGGYHIDVTHEEFAALAQNLHKRVLLDRTGFWFASTSEELTALRSYVQHLHENKDSRLSGYPFDSVVVQLAIERPVRA